MKQSVTIFLLGLMLTVNSCGPSTAETNQPINGKFAFQGTRDGVGSKYTATYLVKGSTVVKISDDAGIAAWSPDGSQVALTAPSDKRISFFDSTGTVKHSITTAFTPTSIDWFADGKKIIYVDEEARKTRLADTFHLMIYDTESKTQTEVLLLENDETIFNVYLSPNNKKAAMTIGSVTNPNVKNRVSVFNLEDKSLRNLSPNARAIGWFPDGVNIAVTTNTRPDGTWIGSPHGVLARVNAETGDFDIIKEQRYEAWDQRLSKDGKYTVYSNSVPSGGSAIFVRSIEADEITQITKPVPVGAGKYSKDSNPTWSQGD